MKNKLWKIKWNNLSSKISFYFNFRKIILRQKISPEHMHKMTPGFWLMGERAKEGGGWNSCSILIMKG